MEIPDLMNVWRDFNKYIPAPAMYESLAEECIELAQAAQKMARVIRGENPTPVTEEEADDMVREEFTDVISCAIGLDLEVSAGLSIMKFQRMQRRCFYEEDPLSRKEERS